MRSSFLSSALALSAGGPGIESMGTGARGLGVLVAARIARTRTQVPRAVDATLLLDPDPCDLSGHAAATVAFRRRATDRALTTTRPGARCGCRPAVVQAPAET